MSQRIISRGFRTGYPFSDFGVGPTAQMSRDQRLACLTAGAWGATAGDDVDHQLFVFHLPEYPKDYAGGAVCQATGYWGAKSGMVEVDGAMFLAEFAPDNVVKPRA